MRAISGTFAKEIEDVEQIKKGLESNAKNFNCQPAVGGISMLGNNSPSALDDLYTINHKNSIRNQSYGYKNQVEPDAPTTLEMPTNPTNGAIWYSEAGVKYVYDFSMQLWCSLDSAGRMHVIEPLTKPRVGSKVETLPNKGSDYLRDDIEYFQDKLKREIQLKPTYLSNNSTSSGPITVTDYSTNKKTILEIAMSSHEEVLEFWKKEFDIIRKESVTKNYDRAMKDLGLE